MTAAGVQLVAISYDSTNAIRRLARRKGITFPLLSDPGSKTIDAYGIRNREAAGSRIDGVPYPGTFLLDRQGVVRAKLFYDGYQERHHSADIRRAILDF